MGKWLAFVFLAGITCLPAAAKDAANPDAASGGAASVGGPTALTPFAPLTFEESQLSQLDDTLERAMETGDFVGLAVAVVRGGETTFLKTYGVIETGGADAVTPNTLFRIASLSKGFASSLAGIAVGEGRLSLNASVTDFAPTLALSGGAEKSLTLSHLLSHRTGLPPNAYDNLLEAGVTPTKILPQYRKVKPVCGVGKCYTYQNITYDIAGQAVATAYGQTYPDLIQTRLFTPLGMTTASVGSAPLAQSGDWARPHLRDRKKAKDAPENPWRVVDVKEPYYLTPAAGGVNASIADMAQWLKAQLGDTPEVLSSGVLELIHTPQVRTPSETRRMRNVMANLTSSQYAYGWRVYDYAGKRIIAHGGSVDGYGAQIAFIPELDTGIVVLANTRTRRLWSIAPMYLDLALSQPQRDWLALDDAETVFAGSQ